jgi:hypothetical protein
MANEEDIKEAKKQSGLLAGVLEAMREQVDASRSKSMEKAMRDLVDNQILDTKTTLKDIEASNSQLDLLKHIADSMVSIESIMALDRLDRKRHRAHAGKVDQKATNMVANTSSGGGGGGGDKGGLLDNDLVKKLGVAAAAKSLAGAAKGVAAMGLAIPAFFGGLMIGNAALGFAEQNTDFADMNFGNIKKAAAGFASVITELDDRALLAIAGVIGISGYAGTKDPLGAAASVGTMGAAISAFLGGLMIGNTAIGLAEDKGADLNFSSLKKAFAGFSSIITEMAPQSLIALAGIIGIAGYGGTKGSKPTDTAVAIAATGAGIVGFLGGFVLGELALSSLGMSAGKYLDLDFPALTKMFGGFNNAITQLSPGSVLALGAIIAAGTAIARTGGANPLKLAGAMAGIGIGIVGLLGGFALGDAALQGLGLGGDQDYDFAAIKNMLGGFNDIITSVDPPALIALGGAVVAAVALAKSGTSGTTFASNMTFIGLGVAGLLGGFMLGEVAVGYGLSKIGGADFPAITSAVEGFNKVAGAMGTETQVAMGFAAGVATFISAKGGFAEGPKFASAMTFIGLGIGGFLAGFGLGEYAISAMEFDVSKTQEAAKGFNSVAEELSTKGLVAFGGILAIGALIAKAGTFADGPKFALAMTGIGLGIGGFFAGFGLGAHALSALGEIDYGGIQEGIKQFGIAVDGLSDKGLVAFGTLLAAGGVLTAVLSFGVALLPLAMGAIGAGIGAFIGGFDGMGALISKTGLDGSGIASLMEMVAKGLKPLEDVDGSNFESLAKGLLAIGPAMAVLLGMEGLGAITDKAKDAFHFLTGGIFKDDETGANAGIFGKLKDMLGDPKQIGQDSIDQLKNMVELFTTTDTAKFREGIDNIAEGMRALTKDDRGFFEKAGDKLTGANNPFAFLIELADKNREITYVGTGVKNLANGFEKINGLGKLSMPDGFDLFIFDVTKQTSVLRSGAKAIDKYIQSMDNLYATGNVAGGGSEAVVGTVEMQNRQEILDANRSQSSQGGGLGPVIAPTTNSSVSSTTNNWYSGGSPPASDNHDETYVFRSSGNPR